MKIAQLISNYFLIFVLGNDVYSFILFLFSGVWKKVYLLVNISGNAQRFLLGSVRGDSWLHFCFCLGAIPIGA